MFSKPIEPPMRIWIDNFDLETKEKILNQAKLEGYSFAIHTPRANIIAGLSFETGKGLGWWSNDESYAGKEHFENTRIYGEEIFWHLKPTRTIDLSNLI